MYESFTIFNVSMWWKVWRSWETNHSLRVLGRSGSSQTSKIWYTKRPYTPLNTLPVQKVCWAAGEVESRCHFISDFPLRILSNLHGMDGYRHIVGEYEYRYHTHYLYSTRDSMNSAKWSRELGRRTWHTEASYNTILYCLKVCVSAGTPPPLVPAWR